MAQLKTQQTDASVDDFLNAIADDQIREDSRAIADIMRKATRAEPRMWGEGMVGFGSYRYKYASGREGDWMLTAFAPRKQRITMYVMSGFGGYDELLAALGQHSCGKSCLHIRRLSDIHVPTLKKLIQSSVNHLKKTQRGG